MTGDLVERLRHDGTLDPDVMVAAYDLTYLVDAADEIDRLRGTLERVLAALDAAGLGVVVK